MSRRLAVLILCAWAGTSRAQTGNTGPPDSTLRPLTVFGYVQVHYRYAFATGEDSLVDNDDFRVQRVRLGIRGDLSNRVSYDVEIDPRAPLITGVLRDAFIALHYVPRHDIRIGQQKTQFGYENRESSTHLYTVNRSEVSDNLSRGVTLRDIGVGLIGNLKLGKGLRLEDAFTLVNGAGMNVQADDTKKKNLWGRLGLRWRDDPADFVARLGVSGGVGDLVDTGDDPVDPADDFRLDFNRWGADAELDHPRGFLAAEVVGGHEENKTTHETDEPLGWYVLLAGKTHWRVGPIARYEDFDDEFKRWTLGAYYGNPDEPFRVLVNYEYRKLINAVRGDDKLYVWTQVRF